MKIVNFFLKLFDKYSRILLRRDGERIKMSKEEKAKLIHKLMSKQSTGKVRKAVTIGRDGFPKIYAPNNSTLTEYKNEIR